MKKASVLMMAVVFVFAVGCKKDKKEEADPATETQVETSTEKKETKSDNSSYKDDKRKVTIALEPKSDSGVSGNVVFNQESGVVTMIAVLGGLSEGTHAIHLHETADCSSADGKSTGGHWNPTKEKHGKWGDAEGYHKGDIGNFTADENGNGTITFITSEWCIGCGDPTKDILGKAVIVHQGVDDFVSQPTGAAGGRVSCGGIIE